jgi:phage head maturation protease
MKKIFAEICKVDEEKRMVYGYASTEAMDVQGEVVTKAAMTEALDEYMKFANIREMHQPSAVGVAKSAEMDDKGCFISVHVVDDSAWAKVKAGVYKGFSIGGKAISKVDGIIKSLRLSEISLVDRPANPEALITVWKADGIDQSPEQAVNELAAMLDKGEISPARLIELAKADMAVSETPGAEPVAEPVIEPAAETAKADEPADLQKGMYTVSWLADLLNSLNSIRNEVKWEAESEGDNSPLPAMLKDAVELLAGILTDMVAEETRELTEEQKADHLIDIAKAGKTISTANMTKLQAMHDHCTTMGAKCATDDAAKADAETTLAKAEVDKTDAIAKVAALETDMAKLSSDNALLKAEVEKLKAMPAPGKALLKAITVSKADDAGFEASMSKVAPVVDAKGDVNDAASLIKMIHSNGGVILR